MKLSRKSVIGIVLVALCFVYTSSASAGMPNTFTTGTAAKANEVNANFDHVNYGNLVVKANGVEIGTSLGHVPGLNGVAFLTHQGYTAAITGDGLIQGTYAFLYLTTDCTGTAYTLASNAVPGDVLAYTMPNEFGMGFITTAGPVYYVSMNAVPVSITVMNSMLFAGQECNLLDSLELPPYTLYPLTPNDPSVTGVGSSYTPPITIQRR